MSDAPRRFVPSGTFAFTLWLQDRESKRLTDNVDALRTAYAATCIERPFQTLAIVVLPNHLHAIWKLPEGDDDFAARWRLIKTRFSRHFPADRGRSVFVSKNGARGIWQRRFWEHEIRTEGALRDALRFCWWDPVRHGLARDPLAWEHSSIHRDQAAFEVMPNPVMRPRYVETWHGGRRAGLSLSASAIAASLDHSVLRQSSI